MKTIPKKEQPHTDMKYPRPGSKKTLIDEEELARFLKGGLAAK